MKRILTLVLLVFFILSSLGSISDAQRRRRRTRTRTPRATGKVAVPCPATLNDITDCPDTGCGPSLDPNLNKQKNIATDTQAAAKKDFQDLAALPDPVPGFKIGNTREKLTALGEGQKITVVAYALVARKGSKESCNCGLSQPSDTDNHIVLVDPSLTSPSLVDETDSSDSRVHSAGETYSPEAGRSWIAISNR